MMGTMEKSILGFRYISIVAVVCSLAGSVLMFFIGAYKTYTGFAALTRYGVSSAPNPTDYITTTLIKSIDAFLIAFVLFIFAYGTYSLFIKGAAEVEAEKGLGWIHIPSIGHLKSKLTEVIIVILFVKFLEVALVNLENLRWELLVLPAAILMLSLGVKFMGLKK